MRNGYHLESLRSYRIWQAMRQRCQNPNNKAYQHYGGRGITVCSAWQSFVNFYADMGECPLGMEIDRINRDGNYTLDNCRWVTHKENVRNSGKSKLTQEAANEIRELMKQGIRKGIIAKKFNVSAQTIDDIYYNKTWT